MNIRYSAQFRAYLALGLGVLSLGFSAIFVGIAQAPGAVTGFYRMIVAMSILAIPFFRRVTHIKKVASREIVIALAAGLLFALDLLLWNTGILISGATNPTLMSNTAPLWVGIGAMICFGERLNRRFWLGILLAMFGARSSLVWTRGMKLGLALC